MSENKKKRKKTRVIPFYKEGDKVFVKDVGIGTVIAPKIEGTLIRYEISINRKKYWVDSSGLAIFYTNSPDKNFPDINSIFQVMNKTPLYKASYRLLVGNLFHLTRGLIGYRQREEKLLIRIQVLQYRFTVAVFLGAVSFVLNVILGLL